MSTDQPTMEKYTRIKSLIKKQLDALQQEQEQQQHKIQSEHKYRRSQKFVLSEPNSRDMCQILDTVFVPCVVVMPLSHMHTESIKQVFHLLETAKECVSPNFKTQVEHFVHTIRPVLIKKYQWSVLTSAHQMLTERLSCVNPKYQQKCVTVHREIMACAAADSEHEHKYIQNVDKTYNKFFEKRKRIITPHSKALPDFESFCSTDLPFHADITSALEMLMIFINDANETSFGKFHVPNILQAIKEEYEAYSSTISDNDLIFIMTYIQNKLDLLLSKGKLEDQFCDKLLSKKEELYAYKEGCIIYQEKSYQIDEIEHSGDETSMVLIQRTRKMDQRFQMRIKHDKVTLDGEHINFPDALLVSQLDINNLWIQIEEMVKDGIPDNCEELQDKIEKLSLPHDSQNSYEFQITSLLQQAQIAQDIPYDIFSFCPPSQWVEQLILFNVRKQYQADDPQFVVNVKQEIEDVSTCFDKSLYCTFYNIFLEESPPKGDSFQVEFLKVLKCMKLTFIKQQLCTLVTEQGIAKAWPEKSPKDVFDEMYEIGLIDCTGVFSPTIDENTIQLYCNGRGLHAHYLNTIYIMQIYVQDLSSKELSFWHHKLSELSLRLSLQDMADCNNDTCDQMLTHIHQLKRHYGEREVTNFMDLLSAKKEKVPGADLLLLFEKSASREWMLEIAIKQLKKFSSLTEAIDHLQSYDWKSERKKQRTAQDIIQFIIKQLSPDEHLMCKLKAIVTKVDKIKEIEKEHSRLSHRVTDESWKRKFQTMSICKYSKEYIAHWVDIFKPMVATCKRRITFDDPLLTEAFAVIRRGITLFYESEKHMKRVVPRDTQMVASLLFCQDLSAQGGALQGTKLMQQISTGEGKTMILCMVAIYKALCGEKVDIVTSSSVLATRDATNQKPLYELFQVSVSHCCHEDLKKRQDVYNSDVIYGDIGSFQRDILETDFYDREIRTNRSYNNVFVDEVDSMLVDKGQNMLYLPHALPDMNSLDQIYLEIWSLVNARDFLGFPDEQEQLHSYLRQTILGLIAPNIFTAISDIDVTKSEEIFECLIKEGIISCDEHSLTTTDVSILLHAINTVEFIREKQLQSEVLMVIQQHIETEPVIHVALHSFIKKSLKMWIQSAVNAKYFRPNKEYIVDIDHRESATDHYPKIIIMDNETGVEQESSKWGSGLHQFLQLKHNLRLSTESLKAVYMSNISFFAGRFTNVLGVTGTLGSAEECILFNKLYKEVQIVTIPTNTPSQLQIEVPVCCSSKNNWEEAIDRDVQEKLNQKRVVLLICEDVEGARRLHQCLTSKHKDLKPKLYFSSHQEKLENKGCFKGGQLIIATNIAGRGTDIKLSETVKDSGGLHVCLSYLPPNVRVELQAYGRAARSGDPGSCKMIFYDEMGDMSYAIRRRDLCEAHRVSEIELDYFRNIQFQEELFAKFKDFYNKKRSEYRNKPEERPQLDHCLDCWAFFLDRYTNAIESIPKKSVEKGKTEKNKILRAFEDDVKCKSTLGLSSGRLMQRGHAFMKQAIKRGNEFKNAGNECNYEESIKAYEMVVSQNPRDPFARYYLAAAKLNHSFKSIKSACGYGKEKRRALKQAFYEIIPLFQDKIRRCQHQITMLQLANRHQDQTVTGGTQYFHEQKQHEIDMYIQFISTMQDVIGKDVTQDLFDNPDWGKEGAQVVFEIIKKEFAKKCHIAKTYTDRLKRLLTCETSYHTYQAKIKETVNALCHSKPPDISVTKEDFTGIFPDKQEFWNLLKKDDLITRETVRKEAENPPKEEKVAYWNPTIDVSHVRLEKWDCVTTESFAWIDGVSGREQEIFSHLKENQVLNDNGQLITLDLARPFQLPESLAPYYKSIKDTLWNHAIYRFVLYHLSKSGEIDMESDISDCDHSEHSMSKQSATVPLKPTTVIDILISMNRKANTCSAHEIQHIQAPSSGPVRHSQISDDNCDLLAIEDHFPSEIMNKEFSQLLTAHNLRATCVSDSGLNCMINAMMQHAKQDYFTPSFKEAEEIRKKLQQKYPGSCTAGMLHCDDEVANEILKLVNDTCSSKVGKVSVVMASSEGPIIYGGTCDQRFSQSQHAVLWQRGEHYVAIVHHQDMIGARYQGDTSVIREDEIPKLNLYQLHQLERMRIVTKTEDGSFRICKPIEEIESILAAEKLKSDSALSEEDEDKMIKFIQLKLEVDFRTLSNSERQLPVDQHVLLYDDLHKYAVIKEVKVKKKAKEIERKCSDLHIKDSFRLTDEFKYITGTRLCYFDSEVLNYYLQLKKMPQLNSFEQEEISSFLSSREAIGCLLSTHDFNDWPTGIENAFRSDSVKFLDPTQTKGVKDFVNLMFKLRHNENFIVSILKGQVSTILELDTPEITLRRLADVFDDQIQEKGDVIQWFVDNQCDLIIDLAEEKWSWKTIITASCIIALGVAQIALGAVLLVATGGAGSLVCNGLISEGVSDMIFGIEGLIRGHCNWSQYFDHKIMSVILTVATAGIGAYLSGGKIASRYTFKAFGTASEEVAKVMAKETGKSFGKVMAKQVCKRIGNEVLGAVKDIGINLICDFIVSKMSQAIDVFSDHIVNSFDSMSEDTDLQEKMSDFLRREHPEKAERYLHEIFNRVSQQKSFLTIWDSIEDKVKTGAKVITDAHDAAAKKLEMLEIKLGGGRLIKCIKNISRFAPFITEAVKIGLVKVKMEMLKEDLKQALDQHQIAEHNETSLNESDIDRIKKQEIQGMKKYLSQEVSQRGKSIASMGVQMVRKAGGAIVKKAGHKIKGHLEMKQLEKYEHQLSTAKKDENHSMIIKYERKMQRLMACTRNPKVYAKLIQSHDAVLGPGFAIPVLEKKIGRPIRIVNKDGETLPNVQKQYAKGEPVVITFTPGKGDQPGQFFIKGHKGFSVSGDNGSDCLIHAVMAGAGISRSDYTAKDIRKDIAKACLDPEHPCYGYIRSGIARTFVKIGLTGGRRIGKSRKSKKIEELSTEGIKRKN